MIALAVGTAFAVSGGSALANPSGASVVNGSASFAVNGTTLSVTNTPGAIINWQQFSIGKDEITRFIQQHAASGVLNRVTSQNPSTILGQLLSNGRVFLINPSGIAFGQGAVIDVAGFAASTLNISDSDFISGRLRFVGHGDEGKLSNAGTIRTPEGGHIYLIAPQVENQASGVITSSKGEVVIAAGKTVELVNARTPDIRVELTAPQNEAINAGEIVASSGYVGVFGTLIKNSGHVSASRAEVGDGGKIVFKAVKDVTLDATSHVEATGVKGGAIKVQAETGTLLAQGVVEAKGEEATGGEIQLLAKQVGLIGKAQVDASGDRGGGTVLVGGDFQGKNPEIQNAEKTYVGRDAVIRADAASEGNGGNIIVWADDWTKFHGAIQARGGAQKGNGGFVEVSGKETLVFRGDVDVTAKHGKSGTLLLDPDSIVIAGGTGGADDGQLDLGTPSGRPLGEVQFDDGTSPVTFTISEDKIESTDADIILQAKNGISTSGSFTNTADQGDAAGTLQLKNNRSLTLQTRNGADEGSTGINLTTSNHGADLEVKVTGGGAVLIQSGTDGTDAGSAPIILPKLTTVGGSITVLAEGALSVNGAVNTTSTVAGTTGGSVRLKATTGDITSAASGTITTTGSVSAAGGTDTAGAGGEVLVYAVAGNVQLGAAINALGGATVEAGDTAGAGGVVTVRADNGNVTLHNVTASAGSIAAGGTGGAGGQISLWTGTSGNTIGQTAGTALLAQGTGAAADGKLKVKASGAVTLDLLNDVATLAGSVTQAGADFTYNDIDALTLDRITTDGALTDAALGAVPTGATQALTTTGGDVVLTTGNTLTVSKGVTADGAGTVALKTTAGNVAVNDSAKVSSTSGTVQVIAAGAITTNTATDTGTEFETSGGLRLDALGGAIGTTTNRIDTNVGTVAARAAGSIFLDEADAVTVGSVAALDSQVPTTLAGLSTTDNNDVTLRVGGAITVAGDVNAGGGIATIDATGAITRPSTGAITAATLNLGTGGTTTVIGATGAPVVTAATTLLDARSSTGGVFLSNTGDVNLTIQATGGNVDVLNSGKITTTATGISSSNSTIELAADKMNLAGPAIQPGPGSSVRLTTRDPSTPIHLGSATDAAAAVELSTAELNTIGSNAATVFVGNGAASGQVLAHSGAINVIGAISPAPAGMTRLHLDNSGDINVNNATLTSPTTTTLSSAAGNINFNDGGRIHAAGQTVTLAASNGRIDGNAADTARYLAGDFTSPNIVADSLVATAATSVGRYVADDPATPSVNEQADKALVTQLTNLSARIVPTADGEIRVYNIGSTNLAGGADPKFAVDSGTGGSFTLVSTGAVTQTHATSPTALHTGGLTAITVNNPGADITLTDTDNDAASYSLFSCLALPGGCPAGTTSPNIGSNPSTASYAAGAINYRDSNGADLFGIGTVSAFSTFTVGNTEIKANSIKASDITLEASGNITLNLGSDVTKINDAGTGSFSLIAGGDIEMLATSGTIGTSADKFDHTLNLTAAGDIRLNESVHQGAKDLKLTANASGPSATGRQVLNPSGSGSVTMQGNHVVRTQSDATIRGVNFSLLGGNQGDAGGQSANGQELTVGGTINLLNTGIITVQAGTADATSAAGARMTGRTINIGAQGSASNPTRLLVQGGINNNFGYVTTNLSDALIELRQPDALVKSTGDMFVFLRNEPGALDAFGSPYSLQLRGGTATASDNGGQIRFVTALGAMRAMDMTVVADGSVLIQGGTSNLNAPGALAASSAIILVENEKRLTTTTADASVIVRGGAANVSPALSTISARNALALGQLDPSKLFLNVGGRLVLEGGRRTGPTGSLVSARVDAGDEMRISVAGRPAPYTYTTSAGASSTVTGSFLMIGGVDSGFFDSNNVPLGGDSYPQEFPISLNLGVPAGYVRLLDSGLGAAVVQTGLATFDESLLSYIIFAANEETRAARMRRGLGEGDDLGAPACN